VGDGRGANNPSLYNISVMKLQSKPQNGTQKFMKSLANKFGFGTWNVKILLRPGLIKELIPPIKHYNIHVTAIHETR
jgi:hypothetical protein